MTRSVAMVEQARSPVHEGLFRREAAEGITLLGGWSPSAHLAHFPRRDRCPYSGADDVTDIDLPTVGVIWASTEVTAPPPGYLGSVPYGIGVVELDVRGTILRVVTRLVDLTEAGGHVGQYAELVADEVPGPDGEMLLTWAFRPTTSSARSVDDGGSGT